MGTHNICISKEVVKKYACCNMKTTNLLDCALIGVCAVIRSNMVITCPMSPNTVEPRYLKLAYFELPFFSK